MILKNFFTPELITLITSIIGSIAIVIITYFANKKKEREAEWRKEKLKFYMNFISALSGITDCEISPQNNIIFAKACNDLYLFAPKGVLNALKQFQNEIRLSNKNKSFTNYTNTLSTLISEIRKDINIKDNHNEEFKVQLWTSGNKI